MPSIGSESSPLQNQHKLSANQKTLLALVGVGSMLEFLDAYLIGFIMAFLVKPWGLTYGIMGTVLLSSGVGAIFGGFAWGSLADYYGRKPIFIASLLTTAFASLGLAFTPEGDWVYMAVLRIIIGFGTGGFFIQVALVQEFVPPHRRGMLTGIVSAITTAGLFLGAFSGAFLVPSLGWRATFAFGAVPALIALIAGFLVPESPRWLILQGRTDEAQKAIAWALMCPPQEVAPPVRVAAGGRKPGWHQIFRWPRNVVTTFLINVGLIAGYYGIVLWTPTLLTQIQGLHPADASRVMIGFSVMGILARLTAAYYADRIGRRRTGGLFALGAGLLIILAGWVGHGEILDPKYFWVLLVLGFTLADGSFSVCAVYSTEIWPSKLRGSGSGFAGLSGSIGKILGPLGLALIAGSHNMVMPAATVAVIVPAFSFLGGCILICAATYLLIGIEAKGQSLEAIDTAHEQPRAMVPGRARTGNAVGH